MAQEEGCWAVLTDRKYYEFDNVNIKRSLRISELLIRADGSLVVRPQTKERLRNEAACMRFVQSHTSVPVPKIICEFEDQDALYLITEHVEGISMMDLPEEQRRIVEIELEQFQSELWSLRSNRIGGPSGLVITPERIAGARHTTNHNWNLRESATDQFVFCHNDYSQQNVIVDPDTLNINAILDWEFAGFYPRVFDRPWYKRSGPAGALPGEEDDKEHLQSFFKSWSRDDNGQITCIIDLDAGPLDVGRLVVITFAERRWRRQQGLDYMHNSSITLRYSLQCSEHLCLVHASPDSLELLSADCDAVQ